jgi:1-aminocyclopropane-1-carboxylate deaminase/D-cysteine desulfhydrase-like pyridoxal-dependent ACC family enzyme
VTRGAQWRDQPIALTPTPVHLLPRLGAALGMEPERLWIKRDDLTGPAGGGNKARKLQALVDDALAHGSDCLVTGGGAQSNHARTTAGVASMAGLDCELVLTGDADDRTGNVLLDLMFGSKVTWLDRPGLPYDELEKAIQDRCRELTAEGRRPYGIPIGGSSALGASAYVAAARELTEQVDPELVVVADGSGGTHAGLVAGFGDHGRVHGVHVGARPDLGAAIERLAAEAAQVAGLPAPTGRCRLDSDHIGAGYGVLDEAVAEAMLTMARTEGIILDPVYTGKAMAGLLAARREGVVGPGTLVVFMHTGGLPGLFARRYTDWTPG